MTVIVGTPLQPATGSNSYTFTVPTGVTSTMVGLFVVSTASGAAFTPTWTATGATFTQIDARAAVNTYALVVKATGLVAGQTVTLGTSPSTLILMYSYYQDVYDFVNTPIGAGIRSGSVTTVTSGSITPTVGQTVVLVGVERTLAAGTTVTSAVSSGGETITQIAFTEAVGHTDDSIYFGSFVASAAAARTATITYHDNSTNAYACLIKTTPIVVPGPVGKPIHFVAPGGTLSSGSAYYTSAPGVLSALKEVRPMPSGYPSVTNMLAQNPFYVAHRGGSADFPEMSLYGYTQSAYWGVGALEISLNRTSDGVWIGCHDATLDRTSGTSGFTISAHTWAEVQAYQITAAATVTPAQPARPYMRWEQLMAAYYNTHVIFVDPKAALSYTTELLAMMDAMPGNPQDRFVAKYYGVVSGWPQSATAHGYKGWGYFYQADVPNIPTYQGRWDILGMDYTANSASWTAIMSYGKPVIGHIIPTAAGVATALGYGAHGCMVSGVQEAIPRSS